MVDPRFLNHGGPAVYADGAAPWGLRIAAFQGHLVMFPTGFEILIFV